MVLLVDEAHVEARFGPFGDSVLMLAQDRCTVCAECTTGSEIILDAPDGKLLGEVGLVKSRSVHLEMVLVLVQDRCMVCAKRTIGSDIV